MVTITRIIQIGLLIAVSMPNTVLSQLGELQLLPQEIPELQAQLADLSLEQSGSIEAANIELSIATQYQALGDHQAASEGFARVLSNQKIRIGLYHPALVPTYSLLLDSLLNQRDLNSALQLIDEMSWLERQGLENDLTARVELLKTLAFWHMSAFNESIDNDSVGHLLSSLEYVNQALESEEEHVLSDPELTLTTLVANWQLERIINSIGDTVGHRLGSSRPATLNQANIELVEELCQRTLPQVSVTSVIYGDGEPVFPTSDGGGNTPLLDTDQLRPYFSRCNRRFSDEREDRSILLETQLESATPNDWVRVGDWYLMTGEINKAEEWYNKAWEATNSQPSELLTRITKPEPLTLSNLLPQTIEIRRGYRDTRTVRYLLDIDTDGQLADVDLNEEYTNPLSEDEYNAVTGWIRSLQFRPPLDGGELEDRRNDLCNFSLAQKQCLPN